MSELSAEEIQDIQNAIKNIMNCEPSGYCRCMTDCLTLAIFARSQLARYRLRAAATAVGTGEVVDYAPTWEVGTPRDWSAA